MSEQGKKRQKPYFFNHKKRKSHNLEPGLKGFLGFCNFREKDCIREAINLLNQYSDDITSKTEEGTSTEMKNTETEEPTKENLEKKSDDEGDIEDELANEIAEVKKTSIQAKRFQVVDSGAKNVLFLRTSIEDPVKIANSIIKDIFETREQKTRFLLRLVPIEITCKANLLDIKENTAKLVDRYFSGEPTTFSVVFNHRNNSNLNKDEIIKEIATQVVAKNEKHTVSLKEPNLAVIVEIIRGICLLSVVPDYMKYKKYNLHQLSEKNVPEKRMVVENEKHEENA